MYIDDLIDNYGMEWISVRKSAKIGAPATMSLDEDDNKRPIFDGLWRSEAPYLCELLDNYPDYLAVSDDKDALVLPAVDNDGKECEYVVVSKADFETEILNYGTIVPDSIKWAKYKKGAKITVGKTKSKYKMTGEDKASDHLLEEGAYVLVRNKGFAKNGKESWIASHYYTAKVAKAEIEGKERYVLVSANTSIKFIIKKEQNNGEENGSGENKERVWRYENVPTGGKLRKSMFPAGGKLLYDIGDNYTFVGWSTDPESETPNVDINTVYTGKEVTVYAILKAKQTSNSGQ